MIDLHSHVLPGIDDGPASEEGSIALAAEIAKSGVTTLAATPHLRADFPGVRVLEIASRVDALRPKVDLELVSGGEVDVLWAQHASDDELRAATYGGRGTDLLVETPYGELPSLFEDLLFKIRVRGFRILLAHPERNPSFQADPARLERLVEGGTLVQLTASSIIGGGRAGKLSQRLIAGGNAHVIAGDMHRAGGSRASLAEAIASLGERGRWMVTDAPAAILAGEPLPPAPPAPERRRWWRR
ncbi:MAG TPA: CpsB/CapC family capsule biosynthesis tyrosine phosphatase [Solirubrobacter sp.]|nr:CpsB/CapC family capsule biosynthesis tyrosine phosphatase [Solirubrobacter sp.]